MEFNYLQNIVYFLPPKKYLCIVGQTSHASVSKESLEIWHELIESMSNFTIDSVLEVISDESCKLWDSLVSNSQPKEQNDLENFCVKYWQLSMIAKVALVCPKNAKPIEFTCSIVDAMCGLLNIKIFFGLNEDSTDFRSEVLFRREMAYFDRDPASEIARHSYIFRSSELFDSDDIISIAPWERRIGVGIEKIFPIVHAIRMLTTNDLIGIYPDCYSKVRGAVPPTSSWIKSNTGDLKEHIKTFDITGDEFDSYIAHHLLITKNVPEIDYSNPFFINPLLEHPIVQLRNGTRLVPIIPFLHNSITEGLYYRWVDDPDYGLHGTLQKNGIQEALGHRFATYMSSQLSIDEDNSICCRTDECSCGLNHEGTGADFIISSRNRTANPRCNLIVETKSKRFTTSFLSDFLSGQPKQATESELKKIDDVIGHAIKQINYRVTQNGVLPAIGLIVYLSPLVGANKIINSSELREIFGLPAPLIPIYVMSSKDFEMVLSLQDYDLILEFLTKLVQDYIWIENEFLDGLAEHAGAHHPHEQNNICNGIHRCQHKNACPPTFPCLHLKDNQVLAEELDRLHLPRISI